MNTGLWWKVDERDALQTHLEKVFDEVSKVACTKQCKGRSLIIFREVGAQHFRNTEGTGAYEGSKAKPNCTVPHLCSPHDRPESCLLDSAISKESEATSRRGASEDPGWSNWVLRNVSSRFPDVPILPYFDLTAPLWDLHPGGKDCTHLCYSPNLVDAVAANLNSLMLAYDRK